MVASGGSVERESTGRGRAMESARVATLAEVADVAAAVSSWSRY